MTYSRQTTKTVTNIVTFTNGFIWEPNLKLANTTPVYSASILIPKTDIKTNEGIDFAIKTATRVGKWKYGARFYVPKKMIPIHDGDDENLSEMFQGCWILNASSLTPPKIFDNHVLPIKDASLIKPGCKIRVSLDFFPYYDKRNTILGMGCKLGNIQKAFTGNDYAILPNVNFDDFSSEFLRIFYADETP